MHSPKATKPTPEDKFIQQRQADELTRLDEEENKRIKRLKRGSQSVVQRVASQVTAQRPAANGGAVGGPGMGGITGRVMRGRQ